MDERGKSQLRHEKEEHASLNRDFSGPSQSVGYSPPPQQPGRAAREKRKSWMLTAGLLAAAGALLLAFVGPQFSEVHQSTEATAAQSDNRQLALAKADIDHEATEYAKQLIATGGFLDANGEKIATTRSDFENGNLSSPDTAPIIPAESQPTAPAGDVSGGKAPPAASPPLPSAKSSGLSDARKEAVRKLVERAPKEDLQRIVAGKQVIYKVRLIDSIDEDGDVVDLFVNNISYGTVPLMHVGAEVIITLPEGTQAEVKVVARADGEGGVTFGAQTSQGEVRTRVMEVGESDSWTVTAR